MSYTYRLEHGHKSSKLHLQFCLDPSDTEFVTNLRKALESLDPKVIFVEDLWMNDEALFRMESNKGEFYLSKDTWGFAFIMNDANQSCITSFLLILLLKEKDIFLRNIIYFKLNNWY